MHARVLVPLINCLATRWLLSAVKIQCQGGFWSVRCQEKGMLKESSQRTDVLAYIL